MSQSLTEKFRQSTMPKFVPCCDEPEIEYVGGVLNKNKHQCFNCGAFPEKVKSESK